jgi:ketosteroid isomerase-like protein
MTEQQTPSSGLDFEALRRAIEHSDAESLTSFYAEDAELLTVNRRTPPSSPEVLRGKEQIAEFLADVCARDMTHRVENEVVGRDRIAFNEACEYPDGLHVLAAATLEVRDGQIVRQVNVEAWDE